MVSFKDTIGLQNVIEDVKPFCKLTKNTNDISSKYIMGDFNDPKFHGLAGHKFSRLCGFTFKSNLENVTNKTFQIVYVPKLRATLIRNNRGLSGWYCWEVLPNGNRENRSIRDIFNIYQFDVTAFFHSDMFEKYVAIFTSNVNYALAHQVKDLLDSIENHEQYTELNFYVSAIKKSIEEIKNVQHYVAIQDDRATRTTADNPNAIAKLAYNANKSYSLRDIDKQNREKNKNFSK